ncbi:MAG: hypothetical protein RBT11_13140 [Desulfobacterales bacterium]|jgi:hypothetical protein|nr:hypothetical protein [Desulfobacterales bacterium]
MIDVSDAQLKKEIDDIIGRIDDIMKRVENLDVVPSADCSKTDEVSSPTHPVHQI